MPSACSTGGQAASGTQRGRPVILKIAAAEMHAAGFRFFRSANGVWLTDEVPPQYISKVEA
jgi:putative RNA 2'-phosphotransferase